MGKVTCKMDSRLSVMLQIPHCILSHKKERLHALLCDSELHVWKWIVFAYHSCMIVFFFFLARFLLPGKHFWFSVICKNLFFPQAMLTSQHCSIRLLWAWLCVFFPSAPSTWPNSISPDAQTAINLLDVLNIQSMQERTLAQGTERSFYIEFSPLLSDFSLRPS